MRGSWCWRWSGIKNALYALHIIHVLVGITGYPHANPSEDEEREDHAKGF